MSGMANLCIDSGDQGDEAREAVAEAGGYEAGCRAMRQHLRGGGGGGGDGGGGGGGEGGAWETGTAGGAGGAGGEISGEVCQSGFIFVRNVSGSNDLEDDLSRDKLMGIGVHKVGEIYGSLTTLLALRCCLITTKHSDVLFPHTPLFESN